MPEEPLKCPECRTGMSMLKTRGTFRVGFCPACDVVRAVVVGGQLSVEVFSDDSAIVSSRSGRSA